MIVLEVSVPVELHKISEQCIDIVGPYRTVFLSGELYAVPGAERSVLLHAPVLSRRCLQLLILEAFFSVHGQDLCQYILHLLTFHDPVNETVVEQELRSLESLRQLLPDRLLDDSRPGKPDQRLWLRQDNISQHRKACRHTARRRIRKDRNIELSCIAVLLQGSRGLCHLHEGNDPLLHPGTPGTGENDHRKLFLRCALHRAGDLLSDDVAHARHHKSSVAYADDCGISIDHDLPRHDSLIQLCALFQSVYFLLISFEIQRIDELHLLIPLFKGALVRQHLHSSVRVDTEIPVALRTNVISVFHVLRDDGGAALVALAKKAFRHLRPCLLQRDIVRTHARLLKHIL